jgi:hypothetical protein
MASISGYSERARKKKGRGASCGDNPSSAHGRCTGPGVSRPHHWHWRLGRRAGGTGPVLSERSGRQRLSLCHCPAPGTEAQELDSGTAPTRHRHEGPSSQGSYPCRSVPCVTLNRDGIAAAFAYRFATALRASTAVGCSATVGRFRA